MGREAAIHAHVSESPPPRRSNEDPPALPASLGNIEAVPGCDRWRAGRPLVQAGGHDRKPAPINCGPGRVRAGRPDGPNPQEAKSCARFSLRVAMTGVEDSIHSPIMSSSLYG